MAQINGRPDRELLMMQTALLWSKRSTCSRLQVGAVLARDKRIVSIGYNGAPKGLPHCSHTADDDSPCKTAVHAEANVMAFAARNGVSTEGTQLFTTHSPCTGCAQLLVNAGVEVVYYNIEFRDTFGIDFLRNAGIEVWQIL